MKKIAVITAIFGDYDEPKIHVKQKLDIGTFCEFLLITDSYAEQSPEIRKQYRTIRKLYNYSTPRMNAKVAKIATDIEILEDYDIIIWVDAQIRILSENYINFMIESLSDEKPLCLVPHWMRDDYTQEMDASLRHESIKYKESRIVDQVQTYEKEGMPAHFGLWAGGAFAYKTDSNEVMNLFNMWFKQEHIWRTENANTNDQISLAYSIWKHDFKSKINNLNFTVWRQMVEFNSHKINK